MTIRVICAVVDVRQLRLYKEDGSTVDILQGDPRLSSIVELCKPLSNPKAFGLPTNASGIPYVEIEIVDPKTFRDTTLADYEANQQKAGRVTRFFRVLKNKIAHLIGTEDADAPFVEQVPSQELGHIPLELTNKAPVVETSKIDNAISDIMANAEPVSEETFDPNTTREDQTIVAVTTTPEGKKAIVPGVDVLAPYMVHANKTGNSKGLEAFISRLGAVISKRGHAVEDVLRFMERGDLPLADDGTIIAYKVLRSTNKHDNSPLGQGIFVDCHTGKVEQRVGSYVCQAESLIDMNNRSQCGTGLHIARRGYLRSFGGDIIVMVKIRPEDVIIVPKGEPDKVRVKGYHILAKIPKNEHETLRKNEAMKGTNALKLLQQAIAGDHIGIIERIEITQPSGGAFIRTPVTDQGLAYQPTIKRETAKAETVAPLPKATPEKLDAPAVDPKKVAKQVEQVKKVEPAPVLTKAEQARQLYLAGRLTELKAFKKAAKKGWDVLGFTPEEQDLILGSKGDSPVTNGQPAAPDNTTKVAKTTAAATNVALPGTKKEEPKMTGTRAEVARILFDQATGTGSAEGKTPDRSRWGALWQHRKECKKGWDLLGFTPKEIERIKLNKPDHI